MVIFLSFVYLIAFKFLKRSKNIDKYLILYDKAVEAIKIWICESEANLMTIHNTKLFGFIHCVDDVNWFSSSVGS